MYQVKVFKVCLVSADEAQMNVMARDIRLEIENDIWHYFGDVPRMISDSDGALTPGETAIMHDRYPEAPEFQGQSKGESK